MWIIWKMSLANASKHCPEPDCAHAGMDIEPCRRNRFTWTQIRPQVVKKARLLERKLSQGQRFVTCHKKQPSGGKDLEIGKIGPLTINKPISRRARDLPWERVPRRSNSEFTSFAMAGGGVDLAISKHIWI